MKSKTSCQKRQESHFCSGSELHLFFPAFTAISVAQTAVLYRKIEGIFCSASCGISFGNEKPQCTLAEWLALILYLEIRD